MHLTGFPEDSIVCPICLGRTGTCHGCKGEKTVGILKATHLIGNVWSKEGCACLACQRIREEQLDIKRKQDYQERKVRDSKKAM